MTRVAVRGRAVIFAVLAALMITAGAYFAFVYPHKVNPQGPGIVLIIAPGLFVAGLGLALLTYAVWSWATGRS